MPHTLLLFDVDGTLITTSGAGVRAMRAVGTRLFGEQFSFDDVTFGGGLDPALFAEAAAQSGFPADNSHHEAFREAYLLELEQEIARTAAGVAAMPGIADLLGDLRSAPVNSTGPMLGLLTGNYAQAAPIKLRAAGIEPEWFTITAFGDEAPTRPGLTELALRRYSDHTGQAADPGRVIVIGDTPRDVHCAKAHQCVSFAVATGPYSPQELDEAGADVVVPDLSDPTPLLSLIVP